MSFFLNQSKISQSTIRAICYGRAFRRTDLIFRNRRINRLKEANFLLQLKDLNYKICCIKSLITKRLIAFKKFFNPMQKNLRYFQLKEKLESNLGQYKIILKSTFIL